MRSRDPERRCVGCGRVTPRAALLRVVLAGAPDQRRIVLDPAGRRPGRGAYLCRGELGTVPAEACLARALRRRALARALRAPVSTPVEFVESDA